MAAVDVSDSASYARIQWCYENALGIDKSLSAELTFIQPCQTSFGMCTRSHPEALFLGSDPNMFLIACTAMLSSSRARFVPPRQPIRSRSTDEQSEWHSYLSIKIPPKQLPFILTLRPLAPLRLREISAGTT